MNSSGHWKSSSWAPAAATRAATTSNLKSRNESETQAALTYTYLALIFSLACSADFYARQFLFDWVLISSLLHINAPAQGPWYRLPDLPELVTGPTLHNPYLQLHLTSGVDLWTWPIMDRYPYFFSSFLWNKDNKYSTKSSQNMNGNFILPKNRSAKSLLIAQMNTN